MVCRSCETCVVCCLLAAACCCCSRPFTSNSFCARAARKVAMAWLNCKMAECSGSKPWVSMVWAMAHKASLDTQLRMVWNMLSAVASCWGFQNPVLISRSGRACSSVSPRPCDASPAPLSSISRNKSLLLPLRAMEMADCPWNWPFCARLPTSALAAHRIFRHAVSSGLLALAQAEAARQMGRSPWPSARFTSAPRFCTKAFSSFCQTAVMLPTKEAQARDSRVRPDSSRLSGWMGHSATYQAARPAWPFKSATSTGALRHLFCTSGSWPQSTSSLASSCQP
mmetsp:Transcript_24605/g.58384  ORF Transcript_24605/g.58384 Transcript_24605/m.58384 type:complete len:282 (+) Transcript_24605:7244-8089(+)